MRRIVTEICENVRDEPWRWRLAGFTYDRDDGVRVWRANMPILNMCLYQPAEVGFGFIGKFVVYFAFRRWLKDMPLGGYQRPAA